MDDGGDDDDIAKDLEVGLQVVIVAELIVNQEEQAQDEPQNDRDAQITDGSDRWQDWSTDEWHSRWQRQN